MRIEVKKAREQRDVSLRALAQRTGLSRSKLHRIEKGERDPGISELELIAKALHVRISDLYESEYK